MFDVLDDELKQMEELSQEGKQDQLEQAVSLNDSIESLRSQKVPVLDESTTLQEVIELLQQKHQSCVILTAGGRISGIFTERDVLIKIVGHRLDLEKEPVSKYMTPNPETLLATDPLAFALNKMTTGGFRHIPILNELGEVQGAVSMQDIINHLGNYFYDEVINLPPHPLRKQEQQEGG